MEFVKTVQQQMDDVKSKLRLHEERRRIEEARHEGLDALASAEAKLGGMKAMLGRVETALRAINQLEEKLDKDFVESTAAGAPEAEFERLVAEHGALLVRRQALLRLERVAGLNLQMAELHAKNMKNAFATYRAAS